MGGATFTVEITYTWNNYPFQDYTVSVYSDQPNLQIISDETRRPHQIHMDGRMPQVFTDYKYRYPLLDGKGLGKELLDLMKIARATMDGWGVMISNWWLLFSWFDIGSRP
jgi:hypothetical protein